MMSGNPSDDYVADDAIIERIDQILEREAQEHKRRRAAPYDGVMGEPPEWVPQWHRDEFIKLRNKLLDDEVCNTPVTSEQVLQWLDAYAEIRTFEDGETFRPQYIPPEVRDTVADLEYLRYAVLLGEEKGLEVLTSSDHAKYVRFGANHSREQSQKARKPRGRVTDDGRTMDEIIGELVRSSDGTDELGDVREANELWPILFSRLDDLGLQPEEIIDPSNPKKTSYLYDFHDRRKPITFGQFANVVSEYRTGKRSG